MLKVVKVSVRNFKRVELVELEPAQVGLTLLGGDNAQGKTSVLDGLAYALGGENYRPSQVQRLAAQHAVEPARLEVTLSNGVVIKRFGKNCELRVTDVDGKKIGQTQLNQMVPELAYNLPAFLRQNDKEKAQTLLRTMGIADKLAEFANQEKALTEKRYKANVVADQKKKFAREMPEYAGVPEKPVEALALVQESQAIFQRNGDRARLRQTRTEQAAACERAKLVHTAATEKVSALEREYAQRLADARAAVESAQVALHAATLVVAQAELTAPTADESTAEVQQKLQELQETNRKIEANRAKAAAVQVGDAEQAKVTTLDEELKALREARRALLEGHPLPLPELSLSADYCLLYNGFPWDCMSDMERMRAGAAIVQRLQPDCGFILVDGMEKMDRAHRDEMRAWLAANDLMAVGTIVGAAEDCTWLIEDGMQVAPA